MNLTCKRCQEYINELKNEVKDLHKKEVDNLKTKINKIDDQNKQLMMQNYILQRSLARERKEKMINKRIIKSLKYKYKHVTKKK